MIVLFNINIQSWRFDCSVNFKGYVETKETLDCYIILLISSHYGIQAIVINLVTVNLWQISCSDKVGVFFWKYVNLVVKSH